MAALGVIWGGALVLQLSARSGHVDGQAQVQCVGDAPESRDGRDLPAVLDGGDD